MPGLAKTTVNAASAWDIVDRHAPVLSESATVGQAIRLMAAERRVGVAIVDREGYYLGACTAQGLVAACIGVRVSSLTDPGHGVARDEIAAARRRAIRQMQAPAVDWQDAEIAVIEHPPPMADVARRLQGGAPMIVVLEAASRKFIGTIEPAQLLATLVA